MARQVAIAGINVPRDAHYEGPLVAPIRSTLIELPSTNLILRSELLDQAPWSPSSATVTADTTVGPDGNGTGDTINVTVANGGLNQAQGKAAAALPYSFSVFLKAGSQSLAYLFFGVSGSYVNGAQVRFDLAAGVISVAAALNGAGWANPSASITPAGNGWYRCTLSVTSDASATIQVGIIGPAIATLIAWGGQLEQLAFPTSYIPTVGSTVSRSADQISAAFNIPPVESTFYAKFVDKGTSKMSVSTGIACFGGSTAGVAPRAVFYYTAGNWLFDWQSGAGNSSSTTPVTNNIGDTIELRGVLGADGSAKVSVSVNGGAEVAGTNPAAQALVAAYNTAQVIFGAYSSTTQGAIALIAAKVARGTRTLAQMQAY
jgi:hypothetical protein